jgi:hypothetical protein
MKNLLISTGILVLVCSFSINGFAQGKGKGNQKKEQTQKTNQGKENVNKGQGQSQNDKGQGQGQVQDNKGQGQNKDKINPGKGDEQRNVNAIDRSRGKEDVRKIISSQGNNKVYDWNRENFKDRGKIRNEGKVTVCHKFNSADEPPVTISISRNALQAHLGHGDVQGDCPAYKGSKTYSDIFLRRRNDYYNTYYGAQDQVVYSQSILDYALQRLTGARTQLVTLQSTNAPAYEIERRQAVVLDLENNVSLLETALAVTAGLLVAKLAY